MDTPLVNNTTYGNGQVVDYAEVFANSGNDVRIINNVAYARQGGSVNDNFNNKNVTYDFNVYFGGSAPAVKGTNDRVMDPLLIDPAGGDFRPRNNSPLIDTGTPSNAPTTDILGVKRPQGQGFDIGAYELIPSGAADARPSGGDRGTVADARAPGRDRSTAADTGAHPGGDGRAPGDGVAPQDRGDSASVNSDFSTVAGDRSSARTQRADGCSCEATSGSSMPSRTGGWPVVGLLLALTLLMKASGADHRDGD